MNIITWCNNNNGFLTAILSVVGLALSIIAIIVSIRTARLPYKKKLILGSSLSVQTQMIPGLSVQMDVAGVSASATNVGNRPISITYLGYAIKKDGKLMKTLIKGECFGALEVICNSNRITEAIAKEKTHILTIPVFWLKNLYGENYRSKWNPEEFKKYMKLKNIKLDHMSTGAYCHKADPVSRRESGIYQAHKK